MVASLSYQHQLYHNSPPRRKRRRTATTVLAGDFDVRPPKDVLTSYIGGAPKYRRKIQRELQMHEKRMAQAVEEGSASMAKGKEKERVGPAAQAFTGHPILAPPATSGTWNGRPSIHIATNHRSLSVTPPPIATVDLTPSSPESTPEPSISSSTSNTSSRRPFTPENDELMEYAVREPTPKPKPPRKKRAPTRKGWKGWVEGSPEPSERLINLDAAPIMEDRRTRSGKNFDAISTGNNNWV